MLALHGNSLEKIASLYGTTFYLHGIRQRDYCEIPLMANSYRFLLQPFLRSEFVYIGDVDVLLTENVLQKHQSFVDSSLPYYNCIRPGTHRLTGLHLARYDHLYPLDPVVWDYSQLNDEEILYKIYELRGCLCQDELVELRLSLGRPICGLHMSVNRLPFSANCESASWEVDVKHLRRLLFHLDSDDIRSVVNLMYRGSRRVLLNVVVIAKGLASMSRSDQLDFLLKKKELWEDS